jgi:hypothetical protein
MRNRHGNIYSAIALMIAVAALLGIVGALFSEPAWPADAKIPSDNASICKRVVTPEGGAVTQCCIVAIMPNFSVVALSCFRILEAPPKKAMG